MNRERAFAELSKELAFYSLMDRTVLAHSVGGMPSQRIFSDGCDELELEVSITWADPNQEAVKVTGTVRGLGTWKRELLEEHLVVRVEC